MHLTSLVVAAALLILQCAVPSISAWQSSTLDASSFDTVGTTSFGGSALRVYRINGVRVAEPRIRMVRSCAEVRYNHLYSKYQLSIPIRIDIATLKSTRGRSRAGRVTVTDLEVKVDKILARKGSRVEVMAQLKRSSGQGQLMFFCDSFIKCQAVRDELASKPEELWSAVKFSPVGRVGGVSVRFGAAKSATAPSFRCARGRWVVFQKRVDGSLSFVQNWNAYVKGFGDVRSNYWMGLDQLFIMTATGFGKGGASHCRLRVEVEGVNGKKYWGEYRKFQVFGPQAQYKLIVGDPVRGSQLGMLNHNGMRFSTYDRDHDAYSGGSCSMAHGFGGWWFNRCHAVNLNGVYSSDKSVRSNENFCSAHVDGKYVPMKRTVMKFKCL